MVFSFLEKALNFDLMILKMYVYGWMDLVWLVIGTMKQEH